MSQTISTSVDYVSPAVFHPADTFSEFRVSGVYTGRVQLQSSIAGKNEWVTEVETIAGFSAPLFTPSLEIDLQIVIEVTSGTVNVHFGP